jgi:hypothetical protein
VNGGANGVSASEITILWGLRGLAEVGRRVIAQMATREGFTEEEFRQGKRYGDKAKTEAMSRLRIEAGWTLRELGQRFGGMRPGAVAHRIYQRKVDTEQ